MTDSKLRIHVFIQNVSLTLLGLVTVAVLVGVCIGDYHLQLISIVSSLILSFIFIVNILWATATFNKELKRAKDLFKQGKL